MCPKTADKWCDRWKQGVALEEGAGDVVSGVRGGQVGGCTNREDAGGERKVSAGPDGEPGFGHAESVVSGPPERVSHKTSGEPRVWGSQDGPELVGAEDTSAFTLVTSLALLIKFSASFLQCLWKYNFVREIHVQLRIF